MPSREELLREYEETAQGLGLEALRGVALGFEPALTQAGCKSYFEFGCGDCAVLVELQRRGLDVTGFEPASSATAAADEVAVYPRFDADLPGIAAGQYDVVLALGSLDRMADAEEAEKILRELFRVARRYVVLGFELPGRLEAADALAASALRMASGKFHYDVRRGAFRTILIEKPACESST